MAKRTELLEAERTTNFMPYLMAAAAWVVPGAGHFWQRRWGRGALLALSVVAMFVLGLIARGKIYPCNPADIVDLAGWSADLGAGGLYLAARFLGYEVPEPSSASADYGTKFLLTAGLLNMLVIMDAFDLGVGRKK
jgi:cytochrome bd-type quinol oxidase subunit 2